MRDSALLCVFLPNFSLPVGALNWTTGETVAVKEIQLSNIPKGELSEIMVSLVSLSHCPRLERWLLLV